MVHFTKKKKIKKKSKVFSFGLCEKGWLVVHHQLLVVLLTPLPHQLLVLPVLLETRLLLEWGHAVCLLFRSLPQQFHHVLRRCSFHLPYNCRIVPNTAGGCSAIVHTCISSGHTSLSIVVHGS